MLRRTWVRLALVSCAWASVAAVITAAWAAPTPSAEDKETARHAYHLGVERYHAGDYHGALEAFEAADQIMAVPTTGLELSRTRAQLGLLVEARDRLLEVTRYPQEPDEPLPFARARLEAQKLADQIESRIPSVQVEVTVPGGPLPSGTRATIRIDGKTLRAELHKVPRRLNPGPHTIEVSAPGYVTQTQTLPLQERDQRVIQFVLTKAPDKGGPASQDRAPSPRTHVADAGDGSLGDGDDQAGVSPLVYVGFGVAGAGVLVGTITGIVTLTETSSLEDACPDKRCTAEQEADLDQARTIGHVSTASFVIGGVGAILGVVGLLLSDFDGAEEPDQPRPTDSTRVELRPLLGLGVAGIQGAF